MNKELTCQQVSALINFYIEGKLNPRLREYINLHIEKCPACKKKIEELKKILAKYKNNNTEKIKQNTEEKLPEESIHKISAYIDNELNSSENIKIKKLTISNPIARKELENMYKFRKIIHTAYEKTKNETHFDYSKLILSNMRDTNDYSTSYFYKLAGLFVILITAIIGGFIYLYF
ncbi:zf-HC2 domain-containing protein [bacterium]|nr:zf-HC2 domain-containing protein [bacterium]